MMTFAEWAEHRLMNSIERAYARDAWRDSAREEREACIAATIGERVDSSVSAEDKVYNTALWHAVEAMQKRSKD